MVRTRFPWRRTLPEAVLARDYLRIVDHHIEHLLPHVTGSIDGARVRDVLDFGCGSGGSAIALAMVWPRVRIAGTDIDADEVGVAQARARLYGVAERCDFLHVDAGERLPFPEASFDVCVCSSVLEYAIDPLVRRFCVQEMMRVLRPHGLLFCSVPNRLYPFEIHTRKWGWNYFPTSLRARTVDSTFWEVRKLARPHAVKLHRTPLAQLFTPWSNFCVRKLDAGRHDRAS
jgi:SAM-dependent methyltransferase